MSVVVAIIALCVVIILHEFGHYIAAVKTGMKVDRFSVFGIGPPILKLGTWRDTEFVISAIPFGAYVLIRGMEPEDNDEAAARKAAGGPAADSVNFRDKPLWARAVVLLGGPAANYLSAMVILFGVFTVAGVRGPHEHLIVSGFGKTSSAQQAGMLLDDELIAIDGQAIEPAKGVPGVNALTGPSRGKTVEVTVRRQGALETLQVEIPEAGAALGIGFQTAPRYAVAVGEAVTKAVSEPIVVTGQQLSALGGALAGLFRGGGAPELGGPVAIVDHIADRARTGLIPFLTTTAFISTLLGMFNLLPMPALDGGRLAFLGYEAVARRRASARIEEYVHGYGMFALLALIAVVTVGDFRRIF
ncbi:MAG: site-2 protease family protein [Myxococcota bacterium]